MGAFSFKNVVRILRTVYVIHTGCRDSKARQKQLFITLISKVSHLRPNHFSEGRFLEILADSYL